MAGESVRMELCFEALDPRVSASDADDPLWEFPSIASGVHTQAQAGPILHTDQSDDETDMRMIGLELDWAVDDRERSKVSRAVWHRLDRKSTLWQKSTWLV